MIESDVPESSGRMTRFFSNPAVGIAGSIASVIGVGLAIYFYLASTTSRDLVYFVHPAKAAVVQANHTSRLRIQLDGKGEAIDKNVTAAQVAVWNEGEDAVRGEHLLSPLIIETGPGNPIIEARIRKTSRDIIGLRLDESMRDDGKLRLDWKILEQNDGAIIQLTYFGDGRTPINVSAIVEGQGSIRELVYDRRIQTADEQYRNQFPKWFGYITLTMGLLMLGFALYFWVRGGLSFQLGALIPPALLMMGLASFVLLWLDTPGPPFGF